MTGIRVGQSGRTEKDFVDIHVVALRDGECRQPNLPHQVGSNLSRQRNQIPKKSFKLAIGLRAKPTARLQGPVKAVAPFCNPLFTVLVMISFIPGLVSGLPNLLMGISK